MHDQLQTDELGSLPPHTEPLGTPSTVESTIAQSVVTETEPPEEPEPQSEDMLSVPLPPPKRYFHLNWWSIVACLLLFLLIGEHGVPLAISFASRFLHPTITVTIFPMQKEVSQTYSFLAVTGTADQAQKQIPSRLLRFTTPTKSETIQTTGIGHTPPVQATGSITFYNAAIYAQTIDAGTVLTGNDGMQVVTDETVLVGAGNPPSSYGIATTSAHSIEAGTGGNIQPLDINGLCCVAGISAKNTSGFTGGLDPQSYPIVSNADVAAEAAHLAGLLDPLAKDAIGKQMKTSEQLLTPFHCTSQTTTTPKVGEKAEQASVTVSETCTSQVYDQGFTVREKTAQLDSNEEVCYS